MSSFDPQEYNKEYYKKVTKLKRQRDKENREAVPKLRLRVLFLEAQNESLRQQLSSVLQQKDALEKYLEQILEPESYTRLTQSLP